MNDFIKWEPIITPIPKDLYFVSLSDIEGILTIRLAEMEDNKVLEFKIKGVMAYRVVDEGARLKTLYENPSYRRFVISDNSSYLKWFHMESREMFEDWGLKHYSIGNVNNIIDIICGSDIVVKWK
ncbi:hypothetical protein [Sphingobacterium spiritivorum]|uniref:hypothetical protein n=1 Tax=Sphingobacterium spiritivorum TaxID=258 RepID=UPI00191ADAC6|nr:hypothetical protein [Sphingobacterium spiritivorum]QQT26619.1 hypothetical protein I6J02_01800 [Sphingobacterium spiritivorum]